MLHRADARLVEFPGFRMRYLATGEDTAGAYALLDTVAAPAGRLGGLHSHGREDEAFWMLEGELTFEVEGRRFGAGPGTYTLIPRGAKHAFGNLGESPCRFLIVLTPAGLESFFEELAAGPADIRALTARYGLDFGL